MTITSLDGLKAALKRSETTPIFIKLHAKWCGHCQAFAPEWEKLKGLVDAQQVGLYDIEETYLTPIKATTGLDAKIKALLEGGFPTMRLVYKGKTTEYDGNRTAVDVLAFIKKNSGAAASSMTGGGKRRKRTVKRRSQRTRTRKGGRGRGRVTKKMRKTKCCKCAGGKYWGSSQTCAIGVETGKIPCCKK